MSESSGDMREDVQNVGSGSSDIDTLVAALRSRSGAVRERAREALLELGKPAVDPLIEALRDDDCQVQWEAAKALGEIGDPAAAPWGRIVAFSAVSYVVVELEKWLANRRRGVRAGGVQGQDVALQPR